MFTVVTLCLEKVSVIDIFQDSMFVKKKYRKMKKWEAREV